MVSRLGAVVYSRVQSGFSGRADAEEVCIYGPQVFLGVQNDQRQNAEADDICIWKAIIRREERLFVVEANLQCSVMKFIGGFHIIARM